MGKGRFQFNMDYTGHYIRGDFESEYADFIKISNPELYMGAVFKVSPIDNQLYISKRDIIRYFKISDN